MAPAPSPSNHPSPAKSSAPHSKLALKNLPYCPPGHPLRHRTSLTSSAKSPKPKSKLALRKDTQPFQIKLALKDDRQISLSERLIMASCKQKKRQNRPSFNGTMAAGPPLDGGKGFHSGWTDATAQPKIDVGTQRAQTCQKKKLTWRTKGGNSFRGLGLKNARNAKRNSLNSRSGYHFPQGSDQPPTPPVAAPLDIVGVLTQLTMVREIKQAQRNLFQWRFKWCRSLRRFRYRTRKRTCLFRYFTRSLTLWILQSQPFSQQYLIHRQV